MQRFIKIKALFLLGVFSILLLHQMWPHVHHVHTVAITNETSEVYHHHHDKNDAVVGILDMLLHNHTHAEEAHAVVILKNTASLDISQNLFTYTALAGKQLLPETAFFFQYAITYPPPDNGFCVFIATPSLRGPPFMG